MDGGCGGRTELVGADISMATDRAKSAVDVVGDIKGKADSFIDHRGVRFQMRIDIPIDTIGDQKEG